MPFTFPSAIDGFLEAYFVVSLECQVHKWPKYFDCPYESSIPSAQWVNTPWNSAKCRKGNVQILQRIFCSFRLTTYAKPKGECQLLSLHHLWPPFMPSFSPCYESHRVVHVWLCRVLGFQTYILELFQKRQWVFLWPTEDFWVLMPCVWLIYYYNFSYFTNEKKVAQFVQVHPNSQGHWHR